MLRPATLEEIKRGEVTDIYFNRTKRILEEKGIHKKVVVELTAKSFPNDIEWAIFTGLSDVIDLLEGLPVSVDAIPEGSVFKKNTPVMSISGDYLDFGVYETAILGLICQASGVTTQAARCALAAKGRPVVAFGTRRMHPVMAPIIDRNAYIGGCSGLSTVLSEKILGIPATGTIPHTLILLCGDTVEATKAFDEIISNDVARIALIDTFSDEKFESVRVAEALKERLYAIRLDTPASRRGNFREILKEVRWELNIRGFNSVKLFVSGGLDVQSILDLNDYADAYGVGTSISNAHVIDFSMDIVEIDGKAVAKRGKSSGFKKVCTGSNPLDIRTLLKSDKEPQKYKLLTETYLEDGKLISSLQSDSKIKKYIYSQTLNLDL